MSGTPQPFNLLRSFSLLSLLCITILSVTSAWLLSRFLTRHMLERDGVVTMQFVQSIMASMRYDGSVQARNEDRRGTTIADFFARAQEPQVKAVFENFFRHIALMPEVLRANVYGRDQIMVWSSDPGLIGKRFPGNPELIKALNGELTIETGLVEHPNKPEHVGFNVSAQYFAEMYLPIRDDDGDTVLGVVEVYKVPDALFAALRQGHRLVWGIAILGGLFLYGTLFWIVRRAAILIRRQQEELVTAETMAALGEMASAVAHNIRNPLASIRAAAEVALDEDDTEFWQQSAGDIIAEVDRLEGWLHSLLTYARPLQAQPSPTPLQGIMERILQEMKKDFERHHITLEYSAASLTGAVLIDPHLLQQALHCVISNAIEAMPEGGTLKVRAQPGARAERLRLVVQDNGVGMTAENLAKVFRPFFTTKRRGLGVGMALTKRIIERHGGTIQLSSTVGQGTTVTIELPLMEFQHVT